ncbi:right-handed parallel beta-helix repeat-containing protein [Tichowtungia aerotolerans]|uniref:Right handed beta helix domain-containing protein n=1 Tax=Tichowtungia aerotolerans TaxID=2697043 RepID=A0A6P1MCZ8_9BACT|nr:right-handed parallel beta-helix repeat-containing protein [Tichowtungia aerotolerans]QHI69938.1 hypothetical protein GT409_10905 [Tichowtungia aerotolerans]
MKTRVSDRHTEKNMREGMGRSVAALSVLMALSAGSEDFSETADPAAELVQQILSVRGEPLRDLPGLRVVHVRDFGAVPNDDINDFAAIQAAVQALGTGNAELRFEPGVYDVDPGGGDYSQKERPILFFQDLENVVVDGQGAQILIKRPSVGLSQSHGCRNMIVRNLSIDYDPLPFSQGTVMSVNPAEGWIEVKTDDGFPDLDDSQFVSYGSWGMLKDPAVPGKLKDGAPNVLFRSSCEKVGEDLFRIVLTNPFDEFLAAGDRYAQISRASGGCEYYNSENITFENITFYAIPGSLFVGADTSRLNVLNCRGTLKDCRMLVSGADGVHCQAARIGPWIERCEFEGLSDDCLNVYSLPFYVLQVHGPKTLRITRPERIRKGDPLVFFRPQTGEILVETEVVSLEKDVVTLRDEVPELNLAAKETEYDQRGWKIYDHAYNPNATGNYFVYRNNYMHDGRRFGGFIKASYGLIENNRFERLSDNGLMVQNEPDWPEGFWANNLVIRNNRILDCAFMKTRIPMEMDWGMLGHRSAGGFEHQNIFFTSNTVRAVAGPAARFNCIDGLTLVGNTFQSGSVSGMLVSGTNTRVRENRDNTPQSRIVFE